MPTEIPLTRNRTDSEFLRVVRPWAWWFSGALGLVSLLLRFAPLPENFSTLGALAFFCGLFLTGPARWLLPGAVLFAADCLGQFLHVPGMGFYHLPSMLLNYIAIAGMASVGAGYSAWCRRSSRPAFASISLLPVGLVSGSLVFFLISNFGAWLDPRMGYESTFAGLAQCYGMGLPFWRSTLSSDLCFGLVFCVGAWGVSQAFSVRFRQSSG